MKNESMIIESYGLSDIGLVRANNEDAFALLTDPLCYLLADGMGGHLAGEIASHEAISYLAELIKSLKKTSTIPEVMLQITHMIKKTNEHVHVLSLRNDLWRGMGTTLCLALLYKEKLIYAHVGDSRIYRIRNGSIERMTQDHSLKDELIAKGQHDESLTFLYKNVITRAIGTHPTVIPDIKVTDLLSGDIYLLCSDGLTDCLTDKEILAVILSNSSIKEAAENLIEEANLCGGNDNITVVMFKIA